MGELVKLIKKVAMEAFVASKPVNLIFGLVIKDYENDGELIIRLEEKLELSEEFFIFASNIDKMSLKKETAERKADRLVIIRCQGGQVYYAADILKE